MIAMGTTQSRHRSRTLVVGLILAWAILFLPSIAVAPDRQPAVLLLAQIVLAGVVLGAGRQGFDLLSLRVLLASVALPLGWVLGYQLEGHLSTCAGGFACFQEWATVGLFTALLAAFFTVVVALPTTLVWNRKPATLKPELPWRRVTPRTWKQWILLGLGIMVAIVGLPILLGIPSPP